MFSKTCQYALQAILYLGLKSKEKKPVGLLEIADSQKIPSHFLSKILQELVKIGMLKSLKGRGGGFSLAKPASKIKLINIVQHFDGKDILDQCGIGLKKCSDETPCPIHHQYKKVKNEVSIMLNEKSLSELAKDIDKGVAIIGL